LPFLLATQRYNIANNNRNAGVVIALMTSGKGRVHSAYGFILLVRAFARSISFLTRVQIMFCGKVKSIQFKGVKYVADI
jgi:hypothetical protein